MAVPPATAVSSVDRRNMRRFMCVNLRRCRTGGTAPEEWRTIVAELFRCLFNPYVSVCKGWFKLVALPFRVVVRMNEHGAEDALRRTRRHICHCAEVEK